MRWYVVGLGCFLMACGRSEQAIDELQQSGGVFGVPNIDDDDGDGRRDFNDRNVAEENDHSVIDLRGVRDQMRKNDALELVLTPGRSSALRVWANGEFLLDEEDASIRFIKDDVPDEIEVEFGGFLSQGTLDVIHLKSFKADVEGGGVFARATLDLLASPLILNHHLQPVESSYVVSGFENGGDDLYSFDNLSMIDAMDDSLGMAIAIESVAEYGFDVWVQDEFETATVTGPGSRIDVVIDSIRDRGLDDYPEEVVAGGRPDTVVRTWGTGALPTSQDAFGNLEVSPPVTVDGVEYPFGRIYWGEFRGVGIVDQLADLLEDQRIQDPFTLDVSFLAVGHVDEFTTFLPDSTSEKGFRLFVTDTNVGFAFLDALPASTPIDPRYDTSHGHPTLVDLREDATLRAINEDYQRDYIDPAIDVMKRELGLTDADIVRVPGIFEETQYGPVAAALIPGTVNLLLHTQADGRATAFLADPFMRAEGAPQSEDPLIAEFNELLPAEIDPIWVDNWDVYHVALGEVHCGTNTTRTPTANWWEDALHLLTDGDL
ncbi:MAG: protein-arginine deiminase family protein [Myxococcota bacterium]